MQASIIRIALAICLFAAGPAPVQAQSTPCTAAATQTDLNRCAGEAFKSADSVLNQTYKGLMGSLSPASAARLKSAQRAWIGFRNAECSFQSNGKDGGSIAPMASANCAASLTRQRSAQLAAIASCPEGEVSCPR